MLLPRLGYDTPQRVCRGCFSEAYRTGGSFAPAEERKATAAMAAGANVGGGYGGGTHAGAGAGTSQGAGPGEFAGAHGGGASPEPPTQDLRSFMEGTRPATQPATVEVATDAMRTVALEPTSS